jgi:acetyl-CoA synthetase
MPASPIATRCKTGISNRRRPTLAIARPDDIRFTDALPKTRSGKIMRRLLREIASGDEVRGDVTTLEDLSILAKLREEEE